MVRLIRCSDFDLSVANLRGFHGVTHFKMMMTCLETDAFLPEYLAGGLSRLEREELLQHLSICRHCASRAAGLRNLRVSISRSVAAVPEPSAREVPQELLHAILAMAGSAADWRQF